MNNKRLGIMRVSLDLLPHVFRLPEGIRITAVRDSSFDYPPRDEIMFKLEGDALPDSCRHIEGAVIVYVTPEYKSLPDAPFAEFIGWHSTNTE